LSFLNNEGGFEMPENKSNKQVDEGYKPTPRKKGYQPSQGNLDTTNPPTGGSGVPSKPQTDSDKTSKD